ncbi:MAG: Ig-like domain-containing protein [candidate division Zixibacteria bacterium]|nr:Ig-like domain-containing protein [candidate division Zixibacteria bacterium]
MRSILVVLLSVLLLTVNCGDQITNNYYSPDPNVGITGRISPIDTGVVTVFGIATVTIDINIDGFFSFVDLPEGTYHVVVSPDHYSRREIFDVAVCSHSVENLGELALSDYPYPIYQTIPADGDDSVLVPLSSRGQSLTIYADEAIDMEDLAAECEIHPTLDGTWLETPARSGKESIYRFLPNDRMQPGTEYTVVIDASVRTVEGVPLGSDMQFSFTTEPLSVSVDLPSTSRLGGIPIREFYPILSFNGYVDPDSLEAAVQYEPEIPGMWYPISSSESQDEDGGTFSRFTFFPTDLPLDPQTDYVITIDAETGLAGGVSLPEPCTLGFTTERLGVVSAYPPDGQPNVYSYVDIRLMFNTEMDSSTTTAAFTLSELDGEDVHGTFSWSGNYGASTMYFDPSDELTSGAIYKISLSSAAQTASGGNLTEEFVSLFGVR